VEVTAGIYRIRNLVNDKVYIGQSKNLEKRLREHRQDLKRGDHPNSYLQNAWNLGQEFEFSVVMYIGDLSCLDSAEAGWFYLTRCCERAYGYNMSVVPSSPMRGRKHSEATKRALSEKLKGRKRGPFPPEHMARLRKPHKSPPPFSDEHRANLSAAQRARYARIRAGLPAKSLAGDQ